MTDFARTPGWLYGRVNLASIAVCGAFAKEADYQTWIYNKSHGYLAEVCGVTEDTIARHAKKLVEVGALTVIRDKNGANKVYRIEMSEPQHKSKPPASVQGVRKNAVGSFAGGTPRKNEGGPPANLPGNPPQKCGPYSEKKNRRETESPSPNQKSGDAEPITAVEIETRLGIPSGGWKHLRSWFARDCRFEPWQRYQHCETDPDTWADFLNEWEKRDPDNRDRPAPNGLRDQLDQGPLRNIRDEARRAEFHEKQRQAEREADEAAKKRNGGGHLSPEKRKALRANLEFLGDPKPETPPKRKHRPYEQGLAPVAI